MLVPLDNSLVTCSMFNTTLTYSIVGRMTKRRARPERKTQKPGRFRSADAESEPEPESSSITPPTGSLNPVMQEALGAIMARLDRMQEQINAQAAVPPKIDAQAAAAPTRQPSPTSDQDDEDSESEHDIAPPPTRKMRRAGTTACDSPAAFQEALQPLSSITGESDEETCAPTHTPHAPVSAFGSLVGDTVTLKLRAKIIANRFVELADLLPHSSHQKAEEFGFKANAGDNTGAFVHKQSLHNLPILQWVEAFDNFSAVYLDRAQTKLDSVFLAKSMMTYKRNIMNLKKMRYDWRAYDRNFRMDMEMQPIPWSANRHDLLIQYQPQPESTSQLFRGKYTGQNTESKPLGKGRNVQARQGKSIPVGYCLS